MSQSSARFPSRDDKYYWSANLDFFKDHLPLEKQTWNALAARGSFSDPAGQDPHSRARRTAPDAAPWPRGAGWRLVQRVAGATSQMAARPAPGQARPGGQSRLSPLTLQGESKAPQARPRGEGRRDHGLVTPEPVPQTRSRGGGLPRLPQPLPAAGARAACPGRRRCCGLGPARARGRCWPGGCPVGVGAARGECVTRTAGLTQLQGWASPTRFHKGRKDAEDQTGKRVSLSHVGKTQEESEE